MLPKHGQAKVGNLNGSRLLLNLEQIQRLWKSKLVTQNVAQLLE
jgi:hypothetical protein